MIDERRLEQSGIPHDDHTERVILGSMMLEPSAVSDALTMLSPDDFYADGHRRLFMAMQHLYSRGEGVDTITVRAEIDRRKEINAVGGGAYILDLTTDIPRRLRIDSYARIVKKHARSRETLRIAQSAFDRAADASEDPQDILDSTINALREVAEDHEDYDLQTAGEFIAAQPASAPGSVDHLATTDGLMTGFAGLDEVTMGLQKGDLIIVAARPSMGKSAWACNVVHHCTVRLRKNIVLFTLEQGRLPVLRRMYSSASRVDLKAIRSGELRPEDVRVIEEKRRLIAEAPMYLDDTSGLTLSRIRAKCMRLKARLEAKGETLDGVFVDQLSHVDGSDVATRGMQTREVVGKQTKGFKKLGKELGVPVVVFNQLGRDVGKRADPKPRLEDLKESGNIEEDADLVLFLHRPEYYDKSDESLRGKAEMILAKHRDGETKTIPCEYQGRIMRWEDTKEPVAKQDSFGSYEQYQYDYSNDRDRHVW